MHTTAPAAEYWPTTQFPHVAQPAFAAKVPAAQLEQASEAPVAGWNWPAAHTTQVVAAAAGWNAPVEQVVQLVEPDAAE